MGKKAVDASSSSLAPDQVPLLDPEAFRLSGKSKKEGRRAARQALAAGQYQWHPALMEYDIRPPIGYGALPQNLPDWAVAQARQQESVRPEGVVRSALARALREGAIDADPVNTLAAKRTKKQAKAEKRKAFNEAYERYKRRMAGR